MSDRKPDPLPPLGTTGVDTGVYGELSWFAGTIRPDGPEEAIGWWLREVLTGTSTVGQSLASTQRYRSGVRADDRRWSIGWEGAGDAAGTVFVEVTQTALDDLGRAEAVELALRLLAAEIRPSRVDLVGVAAGERLDLATLVREWEAGRARTRVRTGREVRTIPEGRRTLYVGSRAGERFGRLYEPPEVDRPWPARLEVELKGGRAQAVGADLLDGRDVGDLWARELRGLIDFPTVPAWGALFD